ncbi:hypothetical protein [Ornithinibacillus xuwenensis]|uniref:YtxH domain-containing protein n=1 Tax=Ornithinibacillus xuwenensis TaxID=3144668 RepID=A0ABU9XEK1_9BACI
MDNRKMMTSLVTIGAAGAAIYGISKGIKNGTFQKMPQSISNLMSNQTIEQIAKPLQGMFPIQPNATSQSMQEQIGNDNKQW